MIDQYTKEMLRTLETMLAAAAAVDDTDTRCILLQLHDRLYRVKDRGTV